MGGVEIELLDDPLGPSIMCCLKSKRGENDPERPWIHLATRERQTAGYDIVCAYRTLCVRCFSVKRTPRD